MREINLDDDKLHRRFLETGCEHDLKLIMEKYEDRIRIRVMEILKDPQDVEEVTNETFFKLFNKRETIKDPNRLLGWLYITAYRSAVDYKRRREGKYVFEFSSLDDEDGKNDVAAAMFAELQEQQAEMLQYQLTGLLRLLSEKEREIVKYIRAGLRPKQIAEVICSTQEAVQKKKERLLEWLPPVADQLDELLDDLPPEDQKVMERYLDDQPIEEISRSLVISPTDIETCVKRVIRKWKKTVRSNTT